MIPVPDAVARIRAAMRPVDSEVVPLGQAFGRVLSAAVAARVSQPPVDVSAMDGYAVRGEDVGRVPATLRRIGEAPAGAAFNGAVGPGETVRIFTGGPLPAGTDTVVLQENVDAAGDQVTVREITRPGRHVRAAGLDFQAGQILLHAGQRLSARDVGLAAAMNAPSLHVRRRPKVAIVSTGSELVPAGGPVGPSRIVDANGPAMAAVVASFGAEPLSLGIARDKIAELEEAAAAAARGADLLITIGGASVGEHDLIQKALAPRGLAVDFWKVALRPGKPLMFGHLGAMPVLGLPGNPVSALVCALLFVRTAIRALLGQPADDGTVAAVLGRDLDANDGRQDYLRSSLERRADGTLVATPFERQDSSMLGALAASGCLVVRTPQAAAEKAGARVLVIPFDLGPGAF